MEGDTAMRNVMIKIQLMEMVVISFVLRKMGGHVRVELPFKEVFAPLTPTKKLL